MSIKPDILRESNVSESTRRRNPHIYDKGVMTTEADVRTGISGDGTAVNTGADASVKHTRPITKGKLNKTERRWLEELKRRGYTPIFAQDVTLRLGDDCRYTPDFFAPLSLPDEDLGIIVNLPVFWEVKGFMRDDALVKIKVAARMHNWARFILVKWKDGQWIETEIKA